MKSSCVFIILIYLISVYAESYPNTLSSLLNMNSEANGSLESILRMLTEMQLANQKEQKFADDKNKTDEHQGQREIHQLSSIVSKNAEILKEAKDRTHHINNDIKDTTGYLEWIHKRKIEIHEKLADLNDERCYSNSMFIKSLKEHLDALAVLKTLREDLGEFSSNKKVSLAQVNDVTQKLSMYTHLFNQQALSDFLQLGRENYEDNNRDQLTGEKFETGIAKRNFSGGALGDKLISFLTLLEDHFRASMKNLQENEIRAAFDMAEFQAQSEAENRTLNQEYEKKKAYKKKLGVDLDVAKQVEAKAQKQFDNSVIAQQQAIKELLHKRQYYITETNRRTYESQTLEAVIKIFKDKVGGIAQYLKDRVEDFQVDHKFDETDLTSRKNDDQIEKDKGRLAENLANEAASQLF